MFDIPSQKLCLKQLRKYPKVQKLKIIFACPFLVDSSTMSFLPQYFVTGINLKTGK